MVVPREAEAGRKPFSAARRRLFEMFSRWPRYLYHGPAREMWSVVHLPEVRVSGGYRVSMLVAD